MYTRGYKLMTAILIIGLIAMPIQWSIMDSQESSSTEIIEVTEPLVEEPTPIIVEIVYKCTCKDIIEEVAIPEPRYGFTDEEIYLLAQLLCGDSSRSGDGEYDFDHQTHINYTEISKVLCVVMNRVRDDRFPDTVEEVVLAKNQFVVFPGNLTTSPSHTAIWHVGNWCRAYDLYDEGAQSIPEDHIYFNGDGKTNTTGR